MISDEGRMEHALSRMQAEAFGFATGYFQYRHGRLPPNPAEAKRPGDVTT